MVPPRFKLSGLYLNSILAKTDALATGFDEAIMLNMDGHVCEGTGENIFLVHGDTIATPTLESNVLPGITRDTVIALARDELGLKVDERPVDRSELYTADEVFLTGNFPKVLPVVQVEDRNYQEGPMSRLARDLYFSFAEREGRKQAA